MNFSRFVLNLLRYTRAKNNFNVKSFGKVIAETKGCSLGNTVYNATDAIRMVKLEHKQTSKSHNIIIVVTYCY